jgi:probable rRNA maturation factor
VSELPFDVTLEAPDGVTLPEPLLLQGVALAWQAVASEAVPPLESLSITFLEDSEILALNRAHLAHDWVPDVLSFALEAGPEARMGDLYIGLDQAARQAAEFGVSLDEELVRLAVHGTLHVLGMDHPEDEPARTEAPMMQVQEGVVRRLFP